MAFRGLRRWAAKCLRTNKPLLVGVRVRRAVFRPAVELLEDRVIPSTFLVINTNDSGPGSFRQAIIDANANPGADLIQFAIAGTGVQSISPTSALPTITDTVTIDGRSEGVFQGNPGYLGPPLIELDGVNTGSTANGLVINASNCSVNGFVINNFLFGTIPGFGSGIEISSGVTGTSLIGNYIGTAADGATAAGNTIGIGIEIGSSSNVIGGATTADRNVISGNTAQGIAISGSNNLVEGNYIGTNAGGNVALPNKRGIEIAGPNNTIGGTTPGAGNVISANTDNDVRIVTSAATNNVLEGNFIGTDATGTQSLQNNQQGYCVDISAPNNTIGGTIQGARNLISGGVVGVILAGMGATGNQVQGNYIGTNLQGTAAIANHVGVEIFSGASNNLIGGPTAAARNIISGNDSVGVLLFLDGVTGNSVQGNYIGTDVTGTAALGNGSSGVQATNGPAGNLIGGAGAGNLIAFNKGDGVTVGDFGQTAQGISILSNSIYSNALLGIDLGKDGVTPNTPGGPHTGPNNLQNYPVLRPYVAAGKVVGTLNSTPNTTFRLEFFANPTWDPSGHGQGKDLLGSLMVTTDAQGNASFTFSFTPIAGEPIITATATDPAGNTSEFSEGVDFAPDDITGRAKESGQIFTNLSTGSSFTSSMWTTWSTGATWVDVVSGDFNGDGLTDIAARDANTGKWWVGLSNGSAFTMSVWTTWSTSATWVDVQVGDFNGDGTADIIGRYSQGGEWWVALSNGSGFTNSRWDTWSTGATWVDVKVGDFNGDGKADITGRYLQGGAWWTGISTGSSFTTTMWTTWSTFVKWVDVQVGDFNGDGKADITGRALETGDWWTNLSTGSSFTYSKWATWSTSVTWVDVKVGDFNGDGILDIVGRALETGDWWVGLSNGSAFTPSKWDTWSTSATWVDVQVGDFNGDGKSDITGRYLQGGDWWTGLSNGSAFTTTKWATWSTGVTWTGVRSGDFA